MSRRRSSSTSWDSTTPNSMECWDYTVELECLQGPEGKTDLSQHWRWWCKLFNLSKILCLMSSYFHPYNSQCRLLILCYLLPSAITNSISTFISLHACCHISYSTPIFSQKFAVCYIISYVSNIFLKYHAFCCSSHCFVWDPASMFHQLKVVFFFWQFWMFSPGHCVVKVVLYYFAIWANFTFSIPVTQI